MRHLHRTLFITLAFTFAACASAPDPKPEEKAPPPETEVKPEPEPDPYATVPKHEQWRARRPEPGPTPELVLPKFEQATLKNGLTVIVAPRPGLPIIWSGVVVRAGSAAEPKGKAGLADFTYELFLEGAGKRDALALADAFADLGTHASVQTDTDGTTIGAQLLKRYLDDGLGLLADVVQRPRLAKADFARKKRERLADLARRVGEPGFLAGEAFAEVIYGKDHPYGHAPSGTPASVATFSLKDVKGFQSASIGPKNAALVLAGDVTLEEAKKLAQKHFGRWKSRAKSPKAPAAIEGKERANVTLVPKVGLGQTILMVGRPALPAGHADEWAVRMATTVYGGLFSSRLNLNLREDKKYTYGARAWLDTRYGPGPLAASSAVRADATGPSLVEVFGEMKGMTDKPISEAELNEARDSVIQSIPGVFGTVGGLGQAAAGFFKEAQPLDRYAQMIAAYQKMDLPTVQKAATEWLDPKMMQVVLVGDPEIIKAQLPAIELGELVERPAADGDGSDAAPAQKDQSAKTTK